MSQELELVPDPARRAVAIAPAYRAAEPAGTTELGNLWPILWHRRIWIIATVAILELATLAYGLLTPSLYPATAQILIDPRDKQVVGRDLSPTALSPDGGITQVETQTRVLESNNVLLPVIEKAGLLTDPEFVAPPGRLAEIGRSLAALVGVAPPAPVKPDGEALRSLRKKLAVKRADKVFVVDLTVTTWDRDKSVRIVNAILDSYLVDQANARLQAGREASTALSARLDEQRERVRSAANEIEVYKARNNLVTSGGKLIDEQQLTEAANQLATARGRVSELRARVAQIDAERLSDTALESASEVVASTVIAKLREQYSDLARNEADLRTRLGRNHPAIAASAAQLENVRRLITAETDRIGRSARSDLVRAIANEKSLAADLEATKRQVISTSEASVRLRELERELEANRAVYESFLVRARETREQASIDTTNARVITRPVPTQDRSWPLMGLLILGALGAGTGLGAGIALTREYVAPTILSRNQMAGAAGAPVVGTLASADNGARLAEAGTILSRILMMRFDQSRRGGQSILMMAGVGDAEVRSETARYLAEAAAVSGRTVLLIQSPSEAGGHQAGFGEVLRGQSGLDHILERRSESGVVHLTVGSQRPGGSRPDAGRTNIQRILAEATRRFDVAIVDAGSLDAMASVQLLAGADHAVLVGRRGATLETAIAQAAETALLSGRRISCCILAGPAATDAA